MGEFDRGWGETQPRELESFGVEEDNEGRPYQCGAFVAGDSRWECILESDHKGWHEWRLRGDVEAIIEMLDIPPQYMDAEVAKVLADACTQLAALRSHPVEPEPVAWVKRSDLEYMLAEGGSTFLWPHRTTRSDIALYASPVAPIGDKP